MTDKQIREINTIKNTLNKGRARLVELLEAVNERDMALVMLVDNHDYSLGDALSGALDMLDGCVSNLNECVEEYADR